MTYKLIFIVQILPKTESEDKYYGKDKGYDEDIKDKINREDSLIRQGMVNYSNGNVQVIIPYYENQI